MLYRTSLTAPVFGLRREIDRLFEDTFGRETGSAWTPVVDIRENQNELRLDVELPGINANDVEITTDNGVLTIRGEKHTERKEDDESRYHLVERSYGEFTRSFQLPPGLDESRIEAAFENGMLSVHIPKSAIPQPKKIQIKGSNLGTQKQVGTQTGQRRMTTGDAGSQTQTPMAASATSQGSKSNVGSNRPKGTEAKS